MIGRYAHAEQFKRMRERRCARCAPPPASAIVDNKGDQGVQIEGVQIEGVQIEGVRILLGPETRHDQNSEGHDQANKRHRTGYRTHEDGWASRWQSAQGRASDALHAVMCGAGHNLRLILAAPRLLRPDRGVHARRHRRADRPCAQQSRCLRLKAGLFKAD